VLLPPRRDSVACSRACMLACVASPRVLCEGPFCFFGQQGSGPPREPPKPTTHAVGGTRDGDTGESVRLCCPRRSLMARSQPVRCQGAFQRLWDNVSFHAGEPQAFRRLGLLGRTRPARRSLRSDCQHSWIAPPRWNDPSRYGDRSSAGLTTTSRRDGGADFDFHAVRPRPLHALLRHVRPSELRPTATSTSTTPTSAFDPRRPRRRPLRPLRRRAPFDQPSGGRVVVWWLLLL